jgi:broad specificity phosphatase PhoE
VGELAPYGFGLVAASPLARAARTAEMLAHGLGLEAPQLDARLMERHVEAWSGLTDAEIEARWPGQPAAWRAADSLAPPRGGEDQASVARRVTACLVELRAAHPQRRLLVVTHGGAIRALDRAAGGSGEPLANLGGRWFEPSAGGLRCTGVFAPRGTPPRRPPASEPRL